MGNGANFFSRDAKGRRSEYVAIAPSKTVNGVKGSIIKKVENSDTHTNLPYYSNTSDVYFRKNANGVCQARVYVFSKGRVHVQVWQENKDGTFSRVSDSARSMSNAEMKKYGPLLKAFCPDIKLR